MRLVNTKSKSSALKAIGEWLKEAHPHQSSDLSKQLLDIFMETHPRISDRFFNSAWAKLQFIDSSIAEKVALSFANENKPILIVHDSFVVLEKNMRFLYERMMLEYKELLGFEPVLEVVLEPSGW